MINKVRNLCMPSFGADMATGTLVEWLVKQGDTIKRGAVIAIIETHKGAMDLDIFDDAVVEQLLLNEGDQVTVGTPIARLRVLGSDAIAQQTMPQIALKSDRNTATEMASSQTDGGNFIATIEAQTPPPFITASPAARALAATHQLSLARLAADNNHEFITLAMVEAALLRIESDAAQTESEPKLEHKPEPKREEQAKKKTLQHQSGFDKNAMRLAISETVTRSKQQIPHYYLSQCLDITALDSYLQAYNACVSTELRILLAAPLLSAIARTLIKNKQLNGLFTKNIFSPSNTVNLVNTVNLRGGGLVMPVIRDAQTLTAQLMMQQLKEQVIRARDGSLRVSEMSGGSCTVTSIGERGAEQMFAVIYPPQVAIIALGSAHLQPLIVDASVQVRSVINASIAADHRVSDGQIGARFLYQLNQQLQKPEQLWSV